VRAGGGAAHRTSFRREAVVSDVHGNPVAMAAVGREVLASRPDALVFCGDLTLGPMPEETWRVREKAARQCRRVAVLRARHAERALAELRSGAESRRPTGRERWMLARHAQQSLDALETFSPALTLNVDGLGDAGGRCSVTALRAATKS
jgi:hypothetical protein